MASTDNPASSSGGANAPAPPRPIRACLFDMDGLLINSEDLYTLCTNAVLHEYGKPSLPWSIKAKLQGRPGPEAGRIFQAWAQLPITHDEMMDKVRIEQRKYFPNCDLLPGIETLLTDLRQARDTKGRKIELALATSSHAQNYRLKTGHLKQHFAVFQEEHVVLGDDKRIPRGRGKPAPDIYLLALETINTRLRREGVAESDLVSPEECLVFEDSVPGVEAGRRAGMQVVWCPHPGLLEEMRGHEEKILAGLMGEHEEEEEMDVKGADGKGRGMKNTPGVMGDSWGRLFETLERFPYADYGIEV